VSWWAPSATREHGCCSAVAAVCGGAFDVAGAGVQVRWAVAQVWVLVKACVPTKAQPGVGVAASSSARAGWVVDAVMVGVGVQVGVAGMVAAVGTDADAAVGAGADGVAGLEVRLRTPMSAVVVAVVAAVAVACAVAVRIAVNVVGWPRNFEQPQGRHRLGNSSQTRTTSV
jgi:hypothetical protein